VSNVAADSLLVLHSHGYQASLLECSRNISVQGFVTGEIFCRGFFFDSNGSDEAEEITTVSKVMVALGICAFCIIMSGVKVVYGRYAMDCSSLWGFKINVRAAWLIQVTSTYCPVSAT
jgi:hypothetical protein